MYFPYISAGSLLLLNSYAEATSSTEDQGNKAHANLMTLTTDCLESTLRSTVLKTQQTASSGNSGDDLSGNIDHIWCIDRVNVKKFKNLRRQCFLRCSAGYSISRDNTLSFETETTVDIDYGRFACVEMNDKQFYHDDFYHWRYADSSSDRVRLANDNTDDSPTSNSYSNTTNNLGDDQPSSEDDNFYGCLSDPCWQPVTLPERVFPGKTAADTIYTGSARYADLSDLGGIIDHPNRYGAWKWNWITDETQAEVFQFGQLKIWKSQLKKFFPGSDFSTSGFTLYLTFDQVVNGRFFTQHGANWSGSNSASANAGKTISFTSTHWNKGDLDSNFNLESWATKFGISGNYNESTHYKQYTQHANFEISFYANHGETLPTDLKIVKVQVIEGTIADTECLEDAVNGHANFAKYGVPNDDYYRSIKAFENADFSAEAMSITEYDSRTQFAPLNGRLDTHVCV